MVRRQRERGRRNGADAGGMEGREEKEGRQVVKEERWRKENWSKIVQMLNVDRANLVI